MAIQYIVRKGTHPRIQGKEVFLGRVKQVDAHDTLSLAEKVADESSATVADVMGVISNLAHVMQTYVMDGYICQLGDFGSFRLTMRSAPCESAELWKPKQFIRPARLTFHPGKQLRMAYETAQFQAFETAPTSEEEAPF